MCIWFAKINYTYLTRFKFCLSLYPLLILTRTPFKEVFKISKTYLEKEFCNDHQSFILFPTTFWTIIAHSLKYDRSTTYWLMNMLCLEFFLVKGQMVSQASRFTLCQVRIQGRKQGPILSANLWMDRKHNSKKYNLSSKGFPETKDLLNRKYVVKILN